MVVMLVVGGAAALARWTHPMATLLRPYRGKELWAAFGVAAVATGGSLFISDIAGYQPCELCWFERVCMYPLSIVLLLFAWYGERRLARYLLPLSLGGAAVSIYHLLIVNAIVDRTVPCLSNPAGVVYRTHCATTWINEFGYVTIPTLALTSFLLLGGLIVLAGSERANA